jgi:hypothetical protein
MSNASIWIGFDPREADAFAVARNSTLRRMTAPIPVHGLMLADMQARGLYTRPTERVDGQLWDAISGAPCSTEFSLSRFLVCHLARRGWALFMDSDVLVRANIARLFDELDPTKAVMCVQHNHEPSNLAKMDGQIQTAYGRKNWSSVMAFNADHPANRALTPEYVNSAKGLELHQFAWLDDDMIGALDPKWNYLVGESDRPTDVAVAHFTLGIPSVPGHQHDEFADEWRAELARWVHN